MLSRSGLSHLRLRVQIAYGLIGVTYLVVALTILLSCQPMQKFWQINPDPGRLCRPTNSPAYVMVVVIPNILTDVYLLSIPLPVSHRARPNLSDVLMRMVVSRCCGESILAFDDALPLYSCLVVPSLS